MKALHYVGSYVETADDNSTAVPSSFSCQARSLVGLRRVEKRYNGTTQKITIIWTEGHISAGFTEIEVSIPQQLMLHINVYNI